MPLLHASYLADPFIWPCGEHFYATGTCPACEDEGAFPLFRSRDLFDWEQLAPLLTKLPAGYGTSYWAPEVAYDAGAYYLYYSVGFEDRLHHLRVAKSPTPEGPYEDCGVALTDPATMPFAIDAHPVRDDDGQWYLFYARDLLTKEEGARIGTALVMDRMASMTALAGEERLVLRPRHDWQRFKAGRVMYGRVYDWHTIEGPSVTRHGDRYYCFFSGGCWENETYGVDYVTARSLCGPWSGDAEVPRLLRTSADCPGPGHGSVLEVSTGVKYYVFHAWDAGWERRQMHMMQLEWREDAPVLTLPPAFARVPAPQAARS